MAHYQAPLKDMQFVLNELVGLDKVLAAEVLDGLDAETVQAVLNEAARFAGDVLSPLNKSGDLQGTQLQDQQVQQAEGFAEAYQQFIDGGWAALPCNPEFGGSGLPLQIACCVGEMWAAANSSFALCPMLGQGAITALEKHGDQYLKTTFLEKLVAGQWTGTMNLTESQAGSDLAAVRSKAVPVGDHYLISGSKIFITWGDHDMTDNIIHLVLARTPDAPEGVKGISLFVVPKYLVDEQGNVGKRNDVYPVAVEHKMGIHASPTCVMNYGEQDGAVGYLVGEENQGLAYMFTMMNHARLNVGLQGVALAEGAYQMARDYARDRVQGVAAGSVARAAIIHHPDVRRMLMLMRALTEASRALCYQTAAAFDGGELLQESASHALADLLTPLAKAWSTEVAQEVTYLAQQVHGGMGFIEEAGIAQFYRDARITTIYEGTTAIQANDFIGRKFLRDGGKTMQQWVAMMREDCDRCTLSDADVFAAVKLSLQQFEESCQWIARQADNPVTIAAVAVNFLMQAGTVAGGWLMLKSLERAEQHAATEDAFYGSKSVTAAFYIQHILPRAASYASAIRAGDEKLMALSEEQF